MLRRLRRALTYLLASGLLAGCQPGALRLPVGVDAPAPVAAEAAGYGTLSVAIKWPARTGRSVQAIPAAANSLELTVSRRDGTQVARQIFNRPSTADGLTATASLLVHVTSTSYLVQIFAYREIATESVHLSADRIIAQGSQDNVMVNLNTTTPVHLQLDPEVTVAGIGGTPALGSPPDLRNYQPIPDPRGPAAWTELNNPDHLVYDPVGHYLYFTEDADSANPEAGLRIARLALDTGHYGNMCVVAGGAAPDLIRDPDSATATETIFVSPAGLAEDDQGRVFVADTGRNRIRMIVGDASSRVAGTGNAGTLADALLTQDGAFASFNAPSGLCFEGTTHKLYVADTGDSCVRAISLGTPGFPVSFVVGGGNVASPDFIPAASMSLPAPRAVAATATKAYVVSGTAPGRLYEVDLNTHQARIVAGLGGDPGSALGTTFGALGGVAVTQDGGTVYFSDTTNNAVWSLNPVDDASLTRVAGTGTPFNGPDGVTAVSTYLQGPTGLLLDGRDLVICDTGNNRVRRVNLDDQKIRHFAGREDGGAGLLNRTDDPSRPAFGGALSQPVAIASGSVGAILDQGSGRVRRYDALGSLTTMAGLGGHGRLSFNVGLDGRELHLPGLTDLVLGGTPGNVASSLYLLTGDAGGPGESVLQIQGLDQVPATETTFYAGFGPGGVTSRVLCENLENEIGAANRVLGVTTSLAIFRNGNPLAGGRLVMSRAGTYHQILEWDGLDEELAQDAAEGLSIWQGLKDWFVGRGPHGYNVDGPPQLIQIDTPRSCRFDSNGALYFLTKNDKGADVLRKVTSGAFPQTSTVAGGGDQDVPSLTSGTAPVLATQANLGSVLDFEMDSRGVLYLASGSRILCFDPVASTLSELYHGTHPFSSFAYDENDRAIYFTYGGEAKIKKAYLAGAF